MTEMDEIKFCPKCQKLLHYKEDFDKVQLWLACGKCGYKERPDNAVVYFKEYPDYEEETDQIPITKDVRCPHCGHGQAGFFEEWLEKKPNIPRTSGGGKSPLVDLSEDIFDSDSDEEAEIARWKKERLRARRKSPLDERNPEAVARWEEKLRADEVTKRAEIQKRKKPEEPEARRALIFVCLNSSCGKTWEGD